jgi:hypothetical protein
MVEDIFQRPSTTLNGYEQSDNNHETTIKQRLSQPQVHPHQYRQSINQERTTIRRTASERITPDEGRFTTTYTALTLRGARGPEAGIITLLLA